MRNKYVLKFIFISLSFIYLTIFFISSFYYRDISLDLKESIVKPVFESFDPYYKGFSSWAFFTVPSDSLRLKVFQYKKGKFNELEIDQIFRPKKLLPIISTISQMRLRIGLYRIIRFYPQKKYWLCDQFNWSHMGMLYFLISPEEITNKEVYLKNNLELSSTSNLYRLNTPLGEVISLGLSCDQ